MMFSVLTEEDDGTIRWKTWEGVTHRVAGPAVIHPDGIEEWYFEGNLHRDDGPAITHPPGSGNSSERWYRHGELHRVDGPAIIYGDGRKLWFYDNVVHRGDGPAIVDPSLGVNQWYIHGHLVDVQETQPGTMDTIRQGMNEKDFVLTTEQVENFHFLYSQWEVLQKFVCVMQYVDLHMLKHDNRALTAIAAWQLPVDDDYLSVALTRPFVREIMRYRTDVADDVHTFVEVVA